MSLFTLMMVVALMVSGMGVALLGSVKVHLAGKLAIDEARVGGLVSLFGFTLIPVIPLAGLLTDQVGRPDVFVGGSALFAASLILLSWARTYAVSLLAVLLMSAGWALLINVGNVLLPLAFPAEAGNTAYSTNLGNVFFGLGAFLTPAAAGFVLGRTSLTTFLIGLAALALLPALLALGVDQAEFVSAANEASVAAGPEKSKILLGDPVIWLLGFALFFYGPLEASLAAWTTTFLGEKGVSGRTATTMLSVFWLAYMAARLLTAFTIPENVELPLLLALALTSMAVLAVGVWGSGRITAIAMVVGCGLCFGPIFPTIMAVLLGHFDSLLHGRAVGMLFGIGGIGWSIIPIFIGSYAQRTSVVRAFRIAVGAAAALAFVVLGLMWWDSVSIRIVKIWHE